MDLAEEDVSSKPEASEPVVSEDLLLTAADILRRSIEHTVRQLGSRKVRGEMKLRWSRSLTRQVEALVKVAEALNKIGSKSAADLDLSSYLSLLESRVPKKLATKKFYRIVAKHRGSVIRYGRI